VSLPLGPYQPVLQDPRLQIGPQELEHALIRNPLCQFAPEPIMADAIEEAL